MAYSDKEWGIVRAFFESGLSLAAITKRPEVSIKDRATISKKAKKEGWLKAAKATLVDREVQSRLEVASIEGEKATLNATAILVHEKLVDERTRHIALFNTATEKNIDLMMGKIDDKTSIYDHRQVQETILKGKETVLGKEQPTTAVQVNVDNRQQATELPCDPVDAARAYQSFIAG